MCLPGLPGSEYLRIPGKWYSQQCVGSSCTVTLLPGNVPQVRISQYPWEMVFPLPCRANCRMEGIYLVIFSCLWGITYIYETLGESVV